jgi:ribosome-binding factor A
MRSRKHSIKKMLLSCDRLGPDDGLDPRYDKHGRPGRVKNRKALQLCAQVAETLRSVLAGECGDAVLRDLTVESVVPAPTSARLLVTLSQAPPATAPIEEVLARLHRAHGLLRSQVAAAITRRRTPDLLFRVLLPSEAA